MIFKKVIEGRTPDVVIGHKDWRAFFEELRTESDRSVAILASAWIDHILKQKLSTLFSKGNADVRRELFDTNGPFSTFSAKCAAAFCHGWIDQDLFHDLSILRKIRNKFAHQIHGLTLSSEIITKLFEKLRIPPREYHDWGQVKCVATKENTGIIMYNGERPENAGEDLVFPKHALFRWAVSLILSYVVASLDVGILVEDDFE